MLLLLLFSSYQFITIIIIIIVVVVIIFIIINIIICFFYVSLDDVDGGPGQIPLRHSATQAWGRGGACAFARQPLTAEAAGLSYSSQQPHSRSSSRRRRSQTR